jgi:hypothetical protein
MPPSVKALLSSIVDYAGLFPPAKLGMGEAMANYARYQTTPYSWMLGRFVVPASRLNELEELLPTFPLKHWSLSVILSGDVELEIDWVRSLNNNQIAIAALEFPPLPPAEIEKVFPRLPVAVESFFEIPLQGDIDAYLAAVRHAGASAKLRTGGITAEAFPSTAQLCQFIVACAKAQVPFKATAGLHHPLPGNYRLTYEPDSPSTVMHGFLNVAILAALVYWQKVTLEEALEVIEESSIKGFQVKADGIAWSTRNLNLAEIEEVRQRFFRSFGSCSFQEPIDDLKELKLLS